MPPSDRPALARYRDRIAACAPEAAGWSLRLVAGEGQYNDIVVAGERLVFRFREGAARLPALVRLLRAVHTLLGHSGTTPAALTASADRLAAFHRAVAVLCQEWVPPSPRT